MRFSIIIPVKSINAYINESVSHLLGLNDPDFEVIILPDTGTLSQIDLPLEQLQPKIRIIPTGPIGPAEKRDQGARAAAGEILAFLDDDAYPRNDWLCNARPHFNDPIVAAVGGPAVTPADDPLTAQASGAVFLSPLGGGNQMRYWPGPRACPVDDWPSVNLLVRKEDFERAGGYNSQYWPGEDTKLCLDLVYTLKKKIIYDPQVFVWHHRRSGLVNHLKQVGGYGRHRGFFAKTYPQSSLRLKYFMPSLFTLFLMSGALLWHRESTLRLIWGLGMFTYGLGLVYSFVTIQIKVRCLRVAFLSLPYILATHLTYGLQFLRGLLLVSRLKSTRRN